MSVKIYMTNWCPYCRNAKTLLNNKGVSYEELNIDELGMTRNDLYDLTGGRTVPQIIINGNSIFGPAIQSETSSKPSRSPDWCKANKSSNPPIEFSFIIICGTV